MKKKLLALMVLTTLSQGAFAQEEQGVSTTSEKSYLMDSIQITDEKDKKERSYESVHSETTVTKSNITKGNASDVSSVLQKVPGVSVSGGSESQNKKISIRGMEGYRVTQSVDGAQRLETTQAGQTSGVYGDFH